MTSLPPTAPIPRRRDESGEAIPRRLVYGPPIVSVDPDALLAAADASLVSTEEGRRRVPWLLARTAIGTARNAARLREELGERARERNAAAESEVAALEVRLREEEEELAVLESRLEGLRVELGGEEPESEERRGALSGLVVETCGVLSAGVGIGLGLGSLLGALDPTDILASPGALALFLGLGLGVSVSMWTVASDLGREVGRALEESKPGRRVAALVGGALLIALCAVFVLIESRVERAGLFRAAIETSSLRVGSVDPGDLSWASLLLSLPAMAACAVSGLLAGVREARRLADREDARRRRAEAASDPRFALAASLEVEARLARERRARTEAALTRSREASLEGLSLTDRRRVEDLESEAAGAAIEARRALERSSAGRGFWSRLLRRRPP